MDFINNNYLTVWIFNLASLCFFAFTLKASSNIRLDEDNQNIKPATSSAPYLNNREQVFLPQPKPWPSQDYINQCIRRNQRVVISRQLTDAELKQKGVHLCYQKSKFIYIFLKPQHLFDYLKQHPDCEFIM